MILREVAVGAACAKPGWVTPDRRLHRRTPLDRPVLIETPRRAATVRSIDVSGGGLKMTAAVDAFVGERVTVYFELPIGVGIETLAEVQRCDAETMVVRFLGLARESELAIRSFCRISGLRPAVDGRSISTSLPAVNSGPESR